MNQLVLLYIYLVLKRTFNKKNFEIEFKFYCMRIHRVGKI